MANILLHSAVPSLLTNPDSASNRLVDTPAESSSTNNKYNGHVTRLRNTFGEHSLMATKVNSDDHLPSCQSLDASSSSSPNGTALTTRSMANHRQERSHENSKQSSSASTNRAFDVLPNGNEDVSYAIVNRRQPNTEQHYDFPADAIEQLKKQQRDDSESNHQSPKLSNEPLTARFLPFNALKRMDHLNTVFVKPTKIEQSLPKLVFSDEHQPTASKATKRSKVHGNVVCKHRKPPSVLDGDKWVHKQRVSSK
jgi:hypothetical protein